MADGYEEDGGDWGESGVRLSCSKAETIVLG